MHVYTYINKQLTSDTVYIVSDRILHQFLLHTLTSSVFRYKKHRVHTNTNTNTIAITKSTVIFTYLPVNLRETHLRSRFESTLQQPNDTIISMNK